MLRLLLNLRFALKVQSDHFTFRWFFAFLLGITPTHLRLTVPIHSWPNEDGSKNY